MLSFLFANLSALQTCKRGTHLGFLHCNASHIFNSFSSVVKLSESAQPKQKQEGNESFTVSYLTNSCGLSPEVAIEVSKRVKLKDPDNPDLVLNLFRSYGFSETQLSKLVKKHPLVLLANPEMTLLPKLRFFQSIGFSCSELADLLTSTSRLLGRSLKNCIIPRYEALKSVIDDDEIVCITIKRSRWNFFFFCLEDVVPNLGVLRGLGVPKSSVSLMLTKFTSVAFLKHAKFVESVKFAMETGIEPSRATFIAAISVFSQMKKSTWESKLDIFERCGMSREVTLLAFRKNPYCMRLSEEKIANSIKFFLNEMRLPMKDIARCAALLGYSLEQRIIPRWSIVKLLMMKGLINKDISSITIATLSEKKFLEQFVIKFQESVPRILNIYRGQLGILPEVSQK